MIWCLFWWVFGTWFYFIKKIHPEEFKTYTIWAPIILPVSLLWPYYDGLYFFIWKRVYKKRARMFVRELVANEIPSGNPRSNVFAKMCYADVPYWRTARQFEGCEKAKEAMKRKYPRTKFMICLDEFTK